MPPIRNQKDIVIRKSDILFFDTNVWINLFVPAKEETDKLTEKVRENASAFFKEVLESGAKVYTSSIVLSEFVNKYLRIMFAAEKAEYPVKYGVKNAYKEVFRESKEYMDYLDEVLRMVELNILSVADKTEDAFSSFNLSNYQQREGREKLDFNDYCIEHICARRNYTLVTADTDYKKANTPCNVIYLI